MTDEELTRKIHYSDENPTSAAELFKKVTRVKNELDEIYDSIKGLVQKQYEL